MAQDRVSMQWRIAISWISGFAIFHLFAPAMMYYEGAKVAGQVGITFAALNGIGTFSMSWMTTKAPNLVYLLVQKNSMNWMSYFVRLSFNLHSFHFSLSCCF